MCGELLITSTYVDKHYQNPIVSIIKIIAGRSDKPIKDIETKEKMQEL